MTITYQNLLPIKQIGDPFVLRTPDGTYYCYATSAPDGIKAWSSRDLVHWTDIGYVYKRQPDSWGKSDFWAPEVVLYNGKYIMHYSARWGKTRACGSAWQLPTLQQIRSWMRSTVPCSISDTPPSTDTFSSTMTGANTSIIRAIVVRTL